MRPLATCCGASYGSRPPRWGSSLRPTPFRPRQSPRKGGGEEKIRVRMIAMRSRSPTTWLDLTDWLTDSRQASSPRWGYGIPSSLRECVVRTVLDLLTRPKSPFGSLYLYAVSMSPCSPILGCFWPLLSSTGRTDLVWWVPTTLEIWKKRAAGSKRTTILI